MWTANSFLEYSKLQRKKFKKDFPTSDKPKKLFKKRYENCPVDEYIFTSNNWNNTDLLRSFIVENMEEKSIDYLTCGKNDNVTIYFSSKDDVKHAAIILKNDFFDYDFYEIDWYKYRGRTDSITKNSYPILLDGYVNLLNLIGVKV